MKRNILIVEDEENIRKIVKDYFSAEDFTVFEACDGVEALEIYEENSIDIVILDVMMPNLDGWAVCRRLRKKSDVPIIMLTARAEEDDELMGLELGADEYVTKPFSPKVLVARATNLLKRTEGRISQSATMMEFGGVKLDENAHKIFVDNEYVETSPKEYALLHYLMRNEGKVLTRESILDEVWGYDYFGDSRVVDTHIKKVRKKLGEYSAFVQTVVRVGYKFEVK